MASIPQHSHTPPLGHRTLTPLYDLTIATMTREKTWRTALIEAVNPSPGDRILDIGSGTGSFAVAIYKACQNIRFVGVDPDADAVRRARRKVAKLSGNIRFHNGHFSAKNEYFEGRPNKIVSSLVLHQVPLAEKRRIIFDAKKTLAPGGSLCIADYGLQQGLQRFLFRSTVQALDGVAHTQPNADGVLNSLFTEAEFESINTRTQIRTLTGAITIFVAGNVAN